MKFGTLVAVLGTVGTVAAIILMAIPALGLQTLGFVLAFAVLAALLGYNSVSSRKRHRALLREIGKIDNRVSRVEYRTEPIHDIRGSVVKTSGGMREALQYLKQLADEERPQSGYWLDPQSVAGAEVQASSVYAPGIIPASAIQDRPNMHVPGRDAARQDMKVPGERNLARLLLAPDSALNREIALVGGEALVTKLEAVGTVTIVTPGMGEAAVSFSTAYLVIDLATLSGTPWQGVLDASRTRLYQELHTAVNAARKRGTVVILHGDAVPTHFTASLEQLAHVRLKNNKLESSRWGNDICSEVVDAISDFKGEGFHTEVSPNR